MTSPKPEPSPNPTPTNHTLLTAAALLLTTLATLAIALNTPAEPPPTPTTALTTASVAARININTATPAELRALPRIGPTLAERIATERDRRGPFRSLNDLDAVKGIGPKTLEQLAPLIDFSTPNNPNRQPPDEPAP